MTSEPQDLEATLHAATAGDGVAATRLLPAVYDALHGMAQRLFRQGGDGVLQPTALVHEAFLKLIPKDPDEKRYFANRTHFLAVSAKAMRQILINQARDAGRIKRGGDREQVTLSGIVSEDQRDDLALIAFTDALEELQELDPEKAAIVEMRVLGGMTFEEISATLAIPRRTIERRWRGTRAWLRGKLLPTEE